MIFLLTAFSIQFFSCQFRDSFSRFKFILVYHYRYLFFSQVKFKYGGQWLFYVPRKEVLRY